MRLPVPFELKMAGSGPLVFAAKPRIWNLIWIRLAYLDKYLNALAKCVSRVG